MDPHNIITTVTLNCFVTIKDSATAKTTVGFTVTTVSPARIIRTIRLVPFEE